LGLFNFCYNHAAPSSLLPLCATVPLLRLLSKLQKPKNKKLAIIGDRRVGCLMFNSPLYAVPVLSAPRRPVLVCGCGCTTAGCWVPGAGAGPLLQTAKNSVEEAVGALSLVDLLDIGAHFGGPNFLCSLKARKCKPKS
jgi:hypothetical protein